MSTSPCTPYSLITAFQLITPPNQLNSNLNCAALLHAWYGEYDMMVWQHNKYLKAVNEMIKA